MNCNTNSLEYKSLESQAGGRVTREILNETGGVVPTVNSLTGASVKNRYTAQKMEGLFRRLSAMNNRLNISLSVNTAKIGEEYIITGVNNNYSPATFFDYVNDETASFKELEEINNKRSTLPISILEDSGPDEGNDYSTQASIFEKTSNSMNDMELSNANTILKEAGKPTISRTDEVDSQETPETLASKRNVEIEEQIQFVRKKLGINVELTTDDSYHGKVEYANGLPTIYLSKNMLQNDTLMHEAIGHVFINAIGGLNHPRVKALAKRLGVDHMSEYDQLEAIADAIGKESSEQFKTKEAKSSFKRFIDWFYDQLSKIFGKSVDDLKWLVKKGLTDYKAYHRMGFVPSRIQYQSIDGNDIYEAMSNTRTEGHPKYVSFKEDEHIYSARGVDNSKSVTDFAFGSKREKLDDYADVKITKNYLIENRNRLPLEIYQAMREESVSISETVKYNDVFAKIKARAAELNKTYTTDREFGSYLHNAIDMYLSNNIKLQDKGFESVYEYLDKLKAFVKEGGYKIIPEMRLFDLETRIAGAVDLVLFNPDTKETIIIDFKTRKQPLVDGKLRESTIDSERNIKYMQQLSMYKNMIEKLYPGANVVASHIQTFDFSIDEESSDYKKKVFTLTSGVNARKPKVYTDSNSEFNEYDRIAARQVGNFIIDDSTEILSSLTQTFRKLVDTLSTNINVNYGNMSKYEKQRLENLLSDLKDYEETDQLLGILSYLNKTLGYVKDNGEFVMGDFDRFLEQMAIESDNPSSTVRVMSKFKNQADSFSILPELLRVLNQPQYKKRLSEIDGGLDSLNALQKSIHELDSMQTIIKERAWDSLSDNLALLSDAHIIEAKDKLMKQFLKENPPTSGGFKFGDKVLTRAEWKAEREKYVLKNLKAIAPKIYKESKAFWYDYLSKGYFDISTMDKLFQDAGNTRSLLIQNVNKRFNQAELAIREKVSARVFEFDKFLQEYSKKTGLSIMKLNELVIDTDSKGEPTGFMVGKYKPELYLEYRKLVSAINDAEPGDARTKASEIKNEWIKQNIVDGKPLMKWEDSKYKQHTELFDAYAKMVSDADLELDGNNVLIKRPKELGSVEFTKLPQVRAESGEHRLKGNFKRWAKDSFLSGFMKVKGEEDAESMPDQDTVDKNNHDDKNANYRVNAGLDGGINRSIPIFYRANLSVDEMTSDISTALIKNYEMSANYNEKTKIQPEMNLILDAMEASRPILKRNGKIMINKASKYDTSIRKTGTSNEFEALQSVIDQRLYGMNMVHSGSFLGMDSAKLVKAVNGLTSKLFLAGNWIGGSVNLMQGEYNNFMNTVSNEHFTPGGYSKGLGDFWKDIGNIFDDVNNSVTKSRTLKFMELIDIQGEFAAFNNPYINNTLFKRVVNKDNLYFMHSIGETMITGSLMYGVMNSVKIMNSDGEYLGKDGKVVSSKDKAASLNDALDIKDGAIIKRIQFTHSSLNMLDEFSELGLSNYIKSLAADLHGQYDDKMKSTVQRTALGTLGMSMRRWLVRTTDKRWRGIAYSTKDWEDMDLFEKGFDEGLREFKEGHYASTIRFFAGVYRSMKDNSWAPQIALNWNTLSDRQKSGVRRTMVDVMMVGALMLLSNALRNLAADEPDDEKAAVLYTQTYLARRLYSEMSFFFNPLEFYRIMKSPAASFGVMDAILRTAGQILDDPSEVYQRGSNEGRYKAWVYFSKIVPGWKQYDLYILRGIDDKVRMQFGQSY